MNYFDHIITLPISFLLDTYICYISGREYLRPFQR